MKDIEIAILALKRAQNEVNKYTNMWAKDGCKGYVYAIANIKVQELIEGCIKFEAQFMALEREFKK